MSISRPTAALTFFVLTLHFAFSQQVVSDCEQQLTLATDEFNAGRFYGVAAILKPCLDGGFSREQRQRANILLAQTYLLLDDPLGAERSYMDVLWANPEFKADTVRDAIDLVYLSRKFTADPIFSLFVKIGGNTSPVRVIHSINSTGEGDQGSNYSWRPGFQFGGGAEWHINGLFSFTAEFSYMHTRYAKTAVKFEGDVLEFLGRQHWFTVPVLFRYTHPVGKLRPFAYLGISPMWLLTERGQINFLKNDLVNEQNITIPAESPTIEMTDYRATFNQSFLLGGGLKYKIGLDYLFGEMRYGFGLRNLVIPTTTFDTSGPMIEYSHVDDYFRLDNLIVSVGYAKPLYKPRKLKRANTRPVLKLLNKRAA